MKLLCMDIETYPNVTYNYGLRNQFIGPKAIEEPSRLLCFSWQWVHLTDASKDGPVKFAALWNSNPHTLALTARNLIDEADGLIGWHSRGFDHPVLLGENLMEGIPDPSEPAHVDLYQLLRPRKLPSKKLEYVSTLLLGEGKMEHEGMIELAVKAHFKKDRAARKRLKEYNMTDVRRTTGVYHRLHDGGYVVMPNVNLFSGDTDRILCPNCGSSDYKRDGFRHTGTGKYQAYRCKPCQRWFQGTRRVDGVQVK